MNIHFIVAPSTHLRPLMMALNEQHHITTLPEELSSETHYVIADPLLSPTHPDLLLAQNLGFHLYHLMLFYTNISKIKPV